MKTPYIAIDGPDGTGKSTQAKHLAQALDAVLVREPGSTPVGQELRELLLHGGDISPRTEALMMAAARSELVDSTVWPALREGRTVVSDRSVFSSLAYQGFGRGVPLEDLVEMNNSALRVHGYTTPPVWPSIVISYSVSEAEATDRQYARGEAPDRFEGEEDAFQARVRDGFGALAREYDFVVVDGEGTVAEVHQRTLEALAEAGISC